MEHLRLACRAGMGISGVLQFDVRCGDQAPTSKGPLGRTGKTRCMALRHGQYRNARLEHGLSQEGTGELREGPWPRDFSEDLSQVVRLFRKEEERHGRRHPCIVFGWVE